MGIKESMMKNVRIILKKGKKELLNSVYSEVDVSAEFGSEKSLDQKDLMTVRWKPNGQERLLLKAWKGCETYEDFSSDSGIAPGMEIFQPRLTKEKPKTPGWYWHRKHGRQSQVVRVARMNVGGNRTALFYLNNYATEILVSGASGLWAGPLPEPPDPEE